MTRRAGAAGEPARIDVVEPGTLDQGVMAVGMAVRHRKSGRNPVVSRQGSKHNCSIEQNARGTDGRLLLPAARVPTRFREGPVAKTNTASSAHQDFVLSSLAPGRRESRLALGITLALGVAFAITAGPLSTIQPARIPDFVPIYATALFVTDLMTAVLLLAQFTILRSRALLAIANGYIFTALIAIPWLLTFPDVFAPSGLLDAGLNTTNWLYILWHGGFPLFVIGYALLKDWDPAGKPWQGSATVAMLASATATVALVCAATLLVTVGHDLLPHTMVDPLRFSTLRLYVAGLQILLNLGALAVLWRRRHSALDLWLMVVMWAHTIEISLISYPTPVRFSMGWYSGRIFGLVSGTLLLFVLLYEITALYGRLLRALEAQRREREVRLMTGDAVAASIAHEINQPLAAMISRGNAGLRWLDRSASPPDLDKVRASLKQVVADGHRAAAVIAGIRAMFKKEVRARIVIDVNALVAEALGLSRDKLTNHRVVVQNSLHSGLPKVMGDPIQLQQVLLNLIANAIDAMAASNQTRMLSVGSDRDGRDRITLWVADTGPGIPSQDMERIFDPLFTTKSDGMGMGLSICRSIIVAHDGELSVSPNTPHGALFRVVLPAEAGPSAERASARSPPA